jgi:hypothetical protein
MGVKRGALAALAFLLVFAAPAAAQTRPGEAEVAAVGAALRGALPPGSNLAIGNRVYDAASGDLALVEVALTGGVGANAFSVTVDRVTVRGLAYPQPGVLSFSEAAIGTVTARFGEADDGLAFTASGASAKAVSAPIAWPAGMADWQAIARIIDATAWDSFVIAPINGRAYGSNGRLDVAFSLPEQSFGRLAAGVVDRVSMFAVEASGSVPDERDPARTMPFSLQLQSQEVVGLNLGAYGVILTGVGESGERPVLKLLDSVRFGGATFSVGDLASGSVGVITGGEQRVRPLRIGYGDLLLDVMSGQEPNIGPGGDPAQMRRYALLMEDLPDFIEIDSFAYSNLDVRWAGDQPGSFRLGAIEAKKVTTVAYGSLAVRDLAFDVPGQARGGLDLFEVRDLDFGGVYRIFGGLLRARFVPNLAEIERNLPALGAWELRGFSLTTPEVGDLSLARAHFSVGPYVGVLPSLIKFGFSDLSLPAAVFRDAAPPRPADLGYDRLTLSHEGAMTYDEAGQRYVIGPVTAGGPGIGDASVSIEFGNVRRVLLAAASIAGAAMNEGASYLDGITFDGFRLEITDAALFRRILAYEARTRGASEASVREEFKAAVEAGLTAAPGFDAESRRILSEAVRRFIDNPARLMVAILPRERFTLRDFERAESDPTVLGKLRIEADSSP